MGESRCQPPRRLLLLLLLPPAAADPSRGRCGRGEDAPWAAPAGAGTAPNGAGQGREPRAGAALTESSGEGMRRPRLRQGPGERALEREGRARGWAHTGRKSATSPRLHTLGLAGGGGPAGRALPGPLGSRWPGGALWEL